MLKSLFKRCIRKIVDFAYDDFVLIDSASEVGKNTFIGRYSAVTKAKIGNYCSIGTNVLIGPGEHLLDKVSTSSLFYSGDAYSVLTEKSIEIGNDVWIGANAVILRGIRIGDGAVIAAGAVVTKTVPDFAVVAGVPAKIIKYRLPEQSREKITASKWWDKDLDAAKRIMEDIVL